MFTRTFRHAPGPELLGNAVVLFAVGLPLHLIEGVVVSAILNNGPRTESFAIFLSLVMRIPAYILYFAAVLMSVLGIVACGIERATVIRRSGE